MSFFYRFETVETKRQLDALTAFVRAHNPGYRNYHDWLDRTRSEIAAGYKEAIIALSNGVVIADGIWQPHKELFRLAEFKNLRVVEEGRGVARFIAKQVEVEAKKRGQVGVIGDVRSNQLGLVRFMTGLGYTPIQTIPLYEPSETDVVVIKLFDLTDRTRNQKILDSVERALFSAAV